MPYSENEIMMNNLLALTKRVRTAFQNASSTDFPGTSLSVAKFPGGCCDDSSMLLAAYLSDNGITGAKLIHGSQGGNNAELRSHDWLQIGNVVLDITADQFNDTGYANDSIICCENSEFHNSFNLEDKGVADFRSQYPEDTQLECRMEFQACYEVLLDKLQA